MPNNKCNRCKQFDRYYTRGVTRFDKTEIGRCYATGNDVSAQGSCAEFTAKTPVKRTRYAIELCLNKIMTDISAVRNMIEESDDGEV